MELKRKQLAAMEEKEKAAEEKEKAAKAEKVQKAMVVINDISYRSSNLLATLNEIKEVKDLTDQEVS